MNSPSDIKAIKILLRIGWLRLRQMLGENLTPKFLRKKKAKPERTATPSKKKGGLVSVIIFGLVMLLGFGVFGIQAVGTVLVSLAPGLGEAEPIEWEWVAYSELGHSSTQWNKIIAEEKDSEPPKILRDYPCPPDKKNSGKEGEDEFKTYEDYVAYAFNEEAEWLEIKPEDRKSYVEKRVRHFEKFGSAGFIRNSRGHFMVARWRAVFSSSKQYLYNSDSVYPRGVGLLCVFLTLAVFFMGGQFGMLQKAGSTTALDDLEWTLAYPVTERAILLAQLFRNALIDTFGWIMLLPVFFSIYYSAGYDLWAIPLALLITVAVKIMCGGLTLCNQIVIPLIFPPKKSASIMGLFSTFGMVSYFAFLFLAQSQSSQSWIRSAAEEIPSFLIYVPPFSAALVIGGGKIAIAGTLLTLFGCIAMGLLSVSIAGKLLRHGRPRESEDNRRSTANSTSMQKGSWFGGVFRAEMLLIVRNRGFLMQVILVPFIVLGYNSYILFNKFMRNPAAVNFEHIAVAAYCVGAYASIFTSSLYAQSLVAGLPMLVTFPKQLSHIMMRQVLTRSMLCLVHPVLILGAAFFFIPFRLGHIPLCILALGCATAISFISGGILALGMDPFATSRKKVVSGMSVMVQMLIMGLPIASFYSQSIWSQACSLVILWLIGFAVWQKLNYIAPYFLDPVESAPPRASMADGLIAVCIFFFLQTVITLIMIKNEINLAVSIFWAFLSAGVLSLLWAYITLVTRKVPETACLLGLKTRNKQNSFPESVLAGVAAGVLASVIAAGYLYLLENVDFLLPVYKAAQQQMLPISRDSLAFAALLIVAAPLIEEMLFRGLLFNSISLSVSPTLAIFASAGIFAFVHPAVSFIPVFCLGAAAAVAYRRSGNLISAIIAHASYNSVVWCLL